MLVSSIPELSFIVTSPGENLAIARQSHAVVVSSRDSLNICQIDHRFHVGLCFELKKFIIFQPESSWYCTIPSRLFTSSLELGITSDDPGFVFLFFNHLS